jgi:hypothetical protein
MKKIGLSLGIIVLLSGCMSLPITPSSGANPVNLNATQTAMLATHDALVATQGLLETQNALVQTQAVVNSTSTAVAATLNAPPTSTNSPQPPTATKAPAPATVTPASLLPPVADTPTNTPIPNLIFSDDFNNGIKADWQQFGTWMVTDGQPVGVTRYKTDVVNSAFRMGVGITLPGTAQLDNIAIEFDFVRLDFNFYLLLDYQNENNFKVINFYDYYHEKAELSAYDDKEGNSQLIPESESKFDYGYPNNHARLEIRGSSLKLFVNQKLIYNYINYPSSFAGVIGFSYYTGHPQFDNFQIFQLP